MKELKLYRSSGSGFLVLTDVIAVVDDDWYDSVSKYTWRVVDSNTTHYAVANIAKIGYHRNGTIFLHHYIMGLPLPGYVTDHINGHGWYCTTANMRIVTRRQNTQNRKTNKTCPYPGVYQIEKTKRFCAQIRINGEKKHLGNFTIAEDAFFAYQKAVRKLGQEVLDYGS
jgi:hypothetical protein